VLYWCFAGALLVLYWCFTGALLVLYWCFTAALRRRKQLYCCFTAALLLYCMLIVLGGENQHAHLQAA